MLIRHRTGISGDFDTDVFDASKYDPDYLKEIMLSPPDTERHYEDVHYYILSRMINKVSGKTLFNFCRENIFLPLDSKKPHGAVSRKVTQSVPQGFISDVKI